MITFVCDDCKSRRHDRCRGGTWCDCSHREINRPIDEGTNP